MGSDGGFYQKSVQNPNGTLPAQQLLCIFFPPFFFLDQSWGLKQGVMLPPSSPGGPISGFLFPAGTRQGPSMQITSVPRGEILKSRSKPCCEDVPLQLPSLPRFFWGVSCLAAARVGPEKHQGSLQLLFFSCLFAWVSRGLYKEPGSEGWPSIISPKMH